MTLTDGTDLWPIGLGRHDHASGTLDRFSNKGRNPVFTQFLNFLFEFAGNLFAELLWGQVTTLAIPERLADMHNIGNRETSLLVHGLHATKACSRDGAAMICIPPTDDDLLFGMTHALPEVARHAHDRVV